MSLPRRSSLTRLFLWTFGIGLLVMLTAAQNTRGDDPPSQEELQKLEAQIADLNKQLEALRARMSESEGEATGIAGKQDLVNAWITSAVRWREIGPATMGGRIIALTVARDDPSTYWLATASGGLLKTVNNGVTFEHQFDKENSVSIGDVAVAPSDNNIVWVGTGEQNARNSVSYGDGVYKSTDGGKTWKNMGLKETFQIGRIAIHPEDPNIVYVGALGRLYGPNEERGLFKTTDGGETWEKIHYLNENTGVIDLQIHPTNPDTLIVATYERRRDEYDTNDPSVKYSEHSGLFKTTDGGKSFTRLEKGLPTVKLGRIGLDYYRKNPEVIFAIVESEEIGKGSTEAATRPFMGIQGQTTEGKAEITSVTTGGPSEKAGIQAGDIITKMGDKEIKTYEDLVADLGNRKAEETIKIKLTREDKEVELDLTFATRPEAASQGGSQRPFSAYLGGQVENVQDRQGEEGYQYGGVYRSEDGGESWTRVNSLNPRPFYFSQIRVDPSDENYVYVLGVSMHRSKDGGKTFTNDGGRDVHADGHALWINPNDGRHILHGCDGGTYVTYDRMERWDHLNHAALGQFYHVALDANLDYKVYGGLQDNGTWGGPSRSSSGTLVNEDWIRVGGGDGFQCQVDPNDADQVYYTSQNGGLARRNFRTGEAASIRPPREEGKTFRFNWNTPFRLSTHNSKIYYCAGNYVWKSLDRGNNLRRISDVITKTDRGSATAFGESPRDSQVLYVGTDEGTLWVTKDGGITWSEISEKVGLAGPRGVATIEPSRFEAGRCYVAFDGHRNDDDRPLLYVTEDYGDTWTRLGEELPVGSTRCLREDPENANLLFTGTEFFVWASMDRGKTWFKLNTNLPTVAVHELAIHPKTNEMVAATHGRSLWVTDISFLRQIEPEILTSKAHLFEPATVIRWRRLPSRGGTNRSFSGQSPSSQATLNYALSKEPEAISLKILDAEGKLVRELESKKEAGLQQLQWDTTRTPEVPERDRQGNVITEAARQRLLARPGRPVPAGLYRVVLTVDGEEFARTIRIERDPGAPADSIAEFDLGVELEEDADEEGVVTPIVD